jgi:hypothetical protein
MLIYLHLLLNLSAYASIRQHTSAYLHLLLNLSLRLLPPRLLTHPLPLLPLELLLELPHCIFQTRRVSLQRSAGLFKRRLPRQYLYLCTSTASKLRTSLAASRSSANMRASSSSCARLWRLRRSAP